MCSASPSASPERRSNATMRKSLSGMSYSDGRSIASCDCCKQRPISAVHLKQNNY